MDLVLLIALVSFIPAALLQLCLYIFGGRYAVALVLLAAIAAPLTLAIQRSIACAPEGACMGSPGDGLAMLGWYGVTIGWCLPTVGILGHWLSRRRLT